MPISTSCTSTISTQPVTAGDVTRPSTPHEDVQTSWADEEDVLSIAHKYVNTYFSSFTFFILDLHAACTGAKSLLNIACYGKDNTCVITL